MTYPKDTTFSVPSCEVAVEALARLAEAREGSRRLDDLVHDALGIPASLAAGCTSNLDDAMDLAELVLPNWSLEMQGNRTPDAAIIAEFGVNGPFLFASFRMPLGGLSYKPVTPPSTGATRAIAVCAAIFAILASEHAVHVGRDMEDPATP